MQNKRTKSIFSTIIAIYFVAVTAVASPAYADKKMDAEMTMQHMHILINHAMQMAAEGSNLAMIGGMGMAKTMDAQTVKHGKMMIEHADEMIDEVMKGDAMKALHAGGLEGDLKKSMDMTHDLAMSAKAYVKKLKSMNHGGGHAKH